MNKHMKQGYYLRHIKPLATLIVLLLMLGGANTVQAQWTSKWLNVGDFQNRYQSSGAAPEGDEVAWHYPGINPSATYSRWKGFWVSAKNVTDEEGKTWPVRVSHIGPRFNGIGEVFDMEQQLISRYEQPTVQVDGADTFSDMITDSTIVEIVVDEVDPSLAPDRMLRQVVNTSIGVTMEQKAMQWSHPDHDNYHIIEYTFTNTGNLDDDDEIEVEQALEDVYFTFLERPTVNAFSGAWDNSAGGVGWGQYTMNDAVGDGVSDYGVDFRAQFSWLGNIQWVEASELNTLGNPMWRNHQWNAIADDTLGRLGGATFVGQVTLHADAEAHAPDASSPDDPIQPRTMTYLNSDFADIVAGSNHTDEPKMAKERKWIECGSSNTVGGGVIGYESADTCNPDPLAPGRGRTWPTHARLVQGQTPDAAHDSDPDFANQTNDPTRGGGAGGWGYMTSYGPYDMALGEVVKIVLAEGVAGLSQEAAWEIGRTYKLAGWNDALVIEFDANGNGAIDEDEAMTKNEWVMTARDSLFKMFQTALDNYNGGLNAPHPPAPPTSFLVTSGTDRVALEWSGPSPAGGWEVWRAQKHYSGIVTALQLQGGIGMPDVAREYELVAELPGNTTSYEDADVERGGEYYYYLQAVGADGVRSSRYYTQTYDQALAVPVSIEKVSNEVPTRYALGQNYPNPFNPTTLITYELPQTTPVTLQVFNALGQTVQTLVNSRQTAGSYEVRLDASTLPSGVYFYELRAGSFRQAKQMILLR